MAYLPYITYGCKLRIQILISPTHRGSELMYQSDTYTHTNMDFMSFIFLLNKKNLLNVVFFLCKHSLKPEFNPSSSLNIEIILRALQMTVRERRHKKSHNISLTIALPQVKYSLLFSPFLSFKSFQATWRAKRVVIEHCIEENSCRKCSQCKFFIWKMKIDCWLGKLDSVLPLKYENAQRTDYLLLLLLLLAVSQCECTLTHFLYICICTIIYCI